MITIAMIRSQLDTLETDPNIHLKVQQPCPSCHKPINIYTVMLGSPGDQAITRQNTQNLDAMVLRGVKSFLGMPKSIRLRLKPQQLFSLRNGFPIRAKAPCPVCGRQIEITLQPS